MKSKQGNNAKTVKQYFNKMAPKIERWRRRSEYYHYEIEKLHKFLIPEKTKVLELGVGTGNLLAKLKPSIGVGIDLSENMIKLAKKRHKSLKLAVADAHKFKSKKKFDYIILSDLIGDLEDVQKVFENASKISHEKTKIVITYYSFLWEPFLYMAEKLGLKMPQLKQNWLSSNDIENLLLLSNLEVTKKGTSILVPVYIPLLSTFFNKYIARLPIFRSLCLVSYFVARKKPIGKTKDYSVSVVIPARNEAGNIEDAIKRTPKLGRSTEIIFVEGGSKDNTLDEIQRVIKKYKKAKIKLVKQGKGIGKGDAVRKGFAKAKGEILMILDADLTVPPEELYKFYEAISSGNAEFVMGSRLVYQPEEQAMRFLNV